MSSPIPDGGSGPGPGGDPMAGQQGFPPAGFPPMQFHDSLGALLLGSLFAMALWGITCIQTHTYLSTYGATLASKEGRGDGRWFRLLIIALWALDTFDSALNCHLLYHYTVSNYLNPAALGIPVWSVILHVAITSIQNFIIRGLFVQRVYRLSNKNILGTAWISALSITDLACGLVITAKAFQISSFLELDTLSSLLYLNFAAGTGADLSVSLALCWLLHTSRTGLKSTDSLINVLIKYTVNTGLIVAVDAAIGMFTYVAMPRNLIFLGFYLLLSKLYLNSYLATLNARDHLRDKLNSPTSIDLNTVSLGSARFNGQNSLRHSSRSRSTAPTSTMFMSSQGEAASTGVELDGSDGDLGFEKMGIIRKSEHDHEQV